MSDGPEPRRSRSTLQRYFEFSLLITLLKRLSGPDWIDWRIAFSCFKVILRYLPRIVFSPLFFFVGVQMCWTRCRI